MRRGRSLLVAWLCLWPAACTHGAAAPPPPPDALEIVQADGAPLAPAFAYGRALDVRAIHAATKKDAEGATWTGVGPCGLDGSTGAVQSLAPVGLGPCTLTASADGVSATASITFLVNTDVSVSISGDTDRPFFIGESRVYSAKVDAPDSGAAEIGFQWTLPTAGVFQAQVVGRLLNVTAVDIGTDSIGATAGASTPTSVITSIPSALHIDASSTHVRTGGNVIIDVQALGPDGARRIFKSTNGLALVGAGGFNVGAAQLGRDGTAFFPLSGATSDCPAIIATDGEVTSNRVEVLVEKIATVRIEGPAAPVVGTTVGLRAVPLDAAGQPFSGPLRAFWSVPTPPGVFVLTATAGLDASAFVQAPGTASIVATVNGASSPPFVCQAVPTP
jgi:hypothetical protein